MTLEEIKTAVDAGKTVCWQNGYYKVVKSRLDYIIKCGNGSCISLTWADGVTMNGKEADFFIEQPITQQN